MLAVKNLSRSFGDIKAVQNISFTADKGEIVGFSVLMEQGKQLLSG
jgi:ABC-type Na+ transport system ATPase subunit NatA